MTVNALNVVSALAPIIVLLLSGCPSPTEGKKPPPTLEVNANRAFRNLEDILSLGPRPSGGEAAEKTAALIAGRIRDAGLAPEIDLWIDQTPAGKIEFRNVKAMLPGRSSNFIIMASHYDTKRLSSGSFIGANDGGSSTALLLEIIRTLSSCEASLPLSVMFVFFDGEECVTRYGEADGLHGSRRLARQLTDDGSLKKCTAMILLDMVGDKNLQITLSADTPEWLVGSVRSTAAELGRSNTVIQYDGVILDDHTPFQKSGIPCVDLIDFNFGPHNVFWHSIEDTIDKVSPESMAFVGNLAIRLIWNIYAFSPAVGNH